MICYKDMTFCSSRECHNFECHRNIPANVPNDIDMPLSIAELKGTDLCPGYISPVQDNAGTVSTVLCSA